MLTVDRIEEVRRKEEEVDMMAWVDTWECIIWVRALMKAFGDSVRKYLYLNEDVPSNVHPLLSVKRFRVSSHTTITTILGSETS